jgi:transcription-repair coupling factor (superfamily II helicase)
LDLQEFFRHFSETAAHRELTAFARGRQSGALGVTGLAGSAAAVLAASVHRNLQKSALFILPDRESSAYFFNDLEALLEEKGKGFEERSLFHFPASYKKPYTFAETDNANVLFRSEVVNRLASETSRIWIVSYPEALQEKVVSRRVVKKHLVPVRKGDRLSVDFLMEVLLDFGFGHTDFVVEPGTFSVRGGIIDVFSYANDYPFRIEIMGGEVESLRSYDPETQLSVKMQDQVSLLPDVRQMVHTEERREFLLHSMPRDTLVWIDDPALVTGRMQEGFGKAQEALATRHPDIAHRPAQELYMSGEALGETLREARVVELKKPLISVEGGRILEGHFSPQPSFNKNFELLVSNLEAMTREGMTNILVSDNPHQLERIDAIFETLHHGKDHEMRFRHAGLRLGLHEGFIDRDGKLVCYTDHQIFERYHRYRIREKLPGKQAMSMKELFNLKAGDYITHIDHGVGIFSGLEMIEVNGKPQEAIRLIYKDNDILYISIHSLHRISRYVGREGTVPSLHRLGSPAWSNLKNKTKKKVKDIAKDLIALYAKRKARQGFAFSPDTYLQNELEASFIFEDTPDQEKATADVKRDMEASHPMDRLICGDVGFGKTEVAIRAAFKAVTDSRQVAVLVPTTILALQHQRTFSERLKDFPCRVDYISRFRTQKEKTRVLKDLATGSIDILIGTHRLLGKDLKFKDLGLLIVDEEQKFGVGAKERLKQLKVDVDTLTLSATPIPRTLQFSLMGARDLSLINTPPPNRYPIITEIHVFNEELIRDAIMQEVGRGGQVFFVHNRVQNIPEVAGVVQRLCPDLRIAIGHGQLDGAKLEEIMVDFIQGDYDVLVSTTIIESGLDIPNANTIIINNAHHFGLSDLHQMRGRVGRTNKKAFCYLLTPPLSSLTPEARKRLRAIEEFSDLGSGFNIAMRDLDIRGAGNILGAEQSGFITEIGYEMYQKILDEAMTELKEQEFRELYQEEDRAGYRVAECQLETDLELLIPSHYVNNIQERLNLYKELDSLGDEKELTRFAAQVADRFGPLPVQTRGLLEAVRLRWEAREAGFEKLILKSGKMIGYFPQGEDAPYFQTRRFGQVLSYAQSNHRLCTLRESKGRLSLAVEGITGIDEAREVAGAILRQDQPA